MSEGLPIFGKEVFDTLFIDYRIMVTFAIISIIMFLAGMYLQLAKWGQGIPEGAISKSSDILPSYVSSLAGKKP